MGKTLARVNAHASWSLDTAGCVKYRGLGTKLLCVPFLKAFILTVRL